MYYRVCGECGAYLDPGERCECQIRKKNFLKIKRPLMRGSGQSASSFIIKTSKIKK